MSPRFPATYEGGIAEAEARIADSQSVVDMLAGSDSAAATAAVGIARSDIECDQSLIEHLRGQL